MNCKLPKKRILNNDFRLVSSDGAKSDCEKYAMEEVSLIKYNVVSKRSTVKFPVTFNQLN